MSSIRATGGGRSRGDQLVNAGVTTGTVEKLETRSSNSRARPAGSAQAGGGEAAVVKLAAGVLVWRLSCVGDDVLDEGRTARALARVVWMRRCLIRAEASVGDEGDAVLFF